MPLKKKASRARAKKKRSPAKRAVTRKRGVNTKKAVAKRATKKSKKVKTVKRYNPLTGRVARVPSDSIEADEWPSRKPAKSRTPLGIAERAASNAVKSLERPAVSAAKKAAAVAAPALAIAAKSALVIAAGVAAYYGTTWLMNNLPARPTLEELNAKAAVAANKGRRETAQKLGRALTADEVKVFSDRFKAALIENKKRFERGVTMPGDFIH